VNTETQARKLLRRSHGWSGLEYWVAAQPWEVVSSGWAVKPDLQGWRFHLEPVPEGIRVSAVMLGALPAVWVVRG
jgi:hypothetical protein